MIVGAFGEGSSAVGVNGDQTNNDAGGSGAAYVFIRSGSTWSQQAYLKASNTDAGDQFGYSVALSGDGNTLTVSANNEASNAKGINGDQTNNGAFNAGAVYVFIRSGSTWSQQAYIKASNSGIGDHFGYSLALSSDGNTLTVGAYGEASDATGINGDQSNNAASNAGAAYVFTRSGSTWSQQAYIKASNTGVSDQFGNSVALSGDGNTLTVGALGEASSATGINGDQTNNGAGNSGAAYVFTRSGSTWSQQAYIKASNAEANDRFGNSVALSGDGDTLSVGAYTEGSNAVGINGDQTSNGAGLSGAVYVFIRSGLTWSQQAYIKASNTDVIDQFGYSVALSGDGNTLTVGAFGEDSNAVGINGGGQADNTASTSGAVYVFIRSGSTWSQQAYVKASNAEANDLFGYSVALSGDSNTMAIGAFSEDSDAKGINGDKMNNGAQNSGAAYVFSMSSVVPTITSLTPNTGPEMIATPVTVTGTGFVAGDTTIVFNGADIVPLSVTPTSATFVTPTNIAASSVPVFVTTTAGTSTSGQTFTFTSASGATVTSVNPSSGPAAGNQQVAVTVSNIPSTFKVFFGTEEATFVSKVGSIIIVTTPPCGSQCNMGTTTVTVSVQDTNNKKRFISHRAPADFTYIVAGTE